MNRFVAARYVMLGLVAAIATLACAQYRAARAQEAQETPWVSVKSPDNTYTAAFPSKPAPYQQEDKQAGKLEGFLWEHADRKSGLFLISKAYVAKSPKAYLEGVVAGDSEHKVAVPARYLDVQGRPAVDYGYIKQFEGKPPQHWRARVVIADDRVYMLQSLSFGKAANEADVARFFESFRLEQPARPRLQPRPLAQGVVYSYPPLGLKFPLPEGWYVNEALKADYRPLLAKQPADSAGKFNLLIANSKLEYTPKEAISLGIKILRPARPGFKSAADYQADLFKSIAGEGVFKVQVIQPPETVRLGGKEFSRAEISMTLGDITVHQRQYERLEGELVISIAAVAPSPKELEKADGILKRATFIEISPFVEISPEEDAEDSAAKD
jgi:hypothetical protein